MHAKNGNIMKKIKIATWNKGSSLIKKLNTHTSKSY